MVGLMASSAVTGKVTTQSSWERNSTKEFQTLEDEREALAIEKSEFLKTKQTFEQEKDQKLAAIGDKEALIQREVKAGIAEENVKFTKWQTALEARKAELDEYERKINAEAVARLKEGQEKLAAKSVAITADAKKLIDTKTDEMKAVTQKAIEAALADRDKAIKETVLWHERYDKLDKPKLPNRRENIFERYCEDYIFYLGRYKVRQDAETIKVAEKTHKFYQTIKCDCADRQPADKVDHYVFWLRLRDPSHLPLLKKEDFRTVIAQTCQTTVPYFIQESLDGLVRVELPLTADYKIPKEYKAVESESKLYDISQIASDRCFLVTGHPGSGKSSVMRWLGQQMGGESAQRLALTPHEEDRANFESAGYAVISEIADIIEQIRLLDNEIKLRSEDITRRFKLVVTIDELGRILDSSDDGQGLMETVRHIAVEGRKLDVVVIVGNHSETVSAIKMDGQFRSSFYELFLVGAARYALDAPGKNTNLKKWEENWIRNESAYPCLGLFNGQYKVCKHPTHHDYLEYKDKGNPPKNIEEWGVNPLTTELAFNSQHLSKQETRKSQFSLSRDEEILLQWSTELKGDFYTVRKASRRAYFAKERGLKETDVRQIVERLNSIGLVEITGHGAVYAYRVISDPTKTSVLQS